MPISFFGISRSRRESLRTTLWIVPATMVVLIVLLFVLTYALDRLASEGNITIPAWMIDSAGADAARTILTAMAAAVITVAGLVFSITILVLQLASQQFGPRMLRNFIRDFGTQASLGTFVSTFVYCVLALGGVQSNSSPGFVPHLTITVALGLTLISLGVLIYFIHHVAVSIQLTSVVSGIARDFRSTLAAIQVDTRAMQRRIPGSPRDDTNARERGAPLFAQSSGFLQAIGHQRLVDIAASSNAVIVLIRRPGHFVVRGQQVGTVSPPAATSAVAEALDRSHLIGPNRTLTQDLGFAIDQLVEIALRALSAAVNDTFTALNCIDWLGDCLCRAVAEPLPDGVYRDERGIVRLVEPVITLERLIKGATDKIRQSSAGVPAIQIRQLENFAKLFAATQTAEQRDIVRKHARLVLAAAEETVKDPTDLQDVRAAYEGVAASAASTGPEHVDSLSGD
ncbi:MAG TPA: DUF2254 domain-containing protein [Chloroflexota bacterium]|jgi:uncharacterized membrane protein|nr:DUF2254 domain-containing protein [Chloroflexota bacterium]